MCNFSFSSEENILTPEQEDAILRVAFAAPNKQEEGTYYRYNGDPNPQRRFCRILMRLNKIYTKDEINQMSFRNENKGFGKGKGSNPYSIFKYVGGSNCKHYWEMVEVKIDEDGLPYEINKGRVSEKMNENVSFSLDKIVNKTVKEYYGR